MYYAIRHFTRYLYSRQVWQSTMEARMHPRSESLQRCFTFQLSVSPRARIFSYTDHLANVVHHFDIPARHRQLTIIADALVDVGAPPPLPPSLGPNAWRELDRAIEAEDYWEMLMPSTFALSTPALEEFARELGADKRAQDPLVMLRDLSSGIHRAFDYVRKSTAVDSPIEDALRSRRGVCQDFTHIFIALARNLRIPCRYVSGYLYASRNDRDLSQHMEGATHAWAEVMLPGLGWIGFDPTHDCLAGERHIRTAIGRDYADVPPTSGTMKGPAKSELQVRVRVTPSEAILPPDQEFAADEEWSRFLEEDQEAQLVHAQQQQQQYAASRVSADLPERRECGPPTCQRAAICYVFRSGGALLPQQRLYFSRDPHGQGAFLATPTTKAAVAGCDWLCFAECGIVPVVCR